MSTVFTVVDGAGVSRGILMGSGDGTSGQEFRGLLSQTFGDTTDAAAGGDGTDTTYMAHFKRLQAKVPSLVSGRIPVDPSGVTSPISAVSLPLPSGAATASAQTTGNASLASIDGKITAVNTGAVTISAALPAGTNTIGAVNIGTSSFSAQAGWGRTTVGTSVVQLNGGTSVAAARGVRLKFPAGGSGVIQIGFTSGVDATNGWEMVPGDVEEIPINNVNKLYAIGTVAGQSLCWQVF